MHTPRTHQAQHQVTRIYIAAWALAEALQVPVETHVMSTLAEWWLALRNATASYSRLGHDRAATANVPQTVRSSVAVEFR